MPAHRLVFFAFVGVCWILCSEKDLWWAAFRFSKQKRNQKRHAFLPSLPPCALRRPLRPHQRGCLSTLSLWCSLAAECLKMDCCSLRIRSFRFDFVCPSVILDVFGLGSNVVVEWSAACILWAMACRVEKEEGKWEVGSGKKKKKKKKEERVGRD